MDYCLSRPCVFGTCESHPGEYTCTCQYNYKGLNCDEGMYFVYIVHIHIVFIYVQIIGFFSEAHKTRIMKYTTFHFIQENIVIDKKKNLFFEKSKILCSFMIISRVIKFSSI